MRKSGFSEQPHISCRNAFISWRSPLRENKVQYERLSYCTLSTSLRYSTIASSLSRTLDFPSLLSENSRESRNIAPVEIKLYSPPGSPDPPSSPLPQGSPVPPRYRYISWRSCHVGAVVCMCVASASAPSPGRAFSLTQRPSSVM